MNQDDDELGRAKLTIKDRLALVEHDSAGHARILTSLTEQIGQADKGFTPAQLTQLREVLHEALADIGLRVDEADQQDAAREDLRFLRRLRLMWDGAVGKVGNAVLIAVVGVMLAIISAGFWAWLSNNILHPK